MSEGVMSEDCVMLVEEASRLTVYLESTKEELEVGGMVDLSDIEARVLEICEKTGKLEKHEAVIMVEPLRDLMGMMERVSQTLEGKRKEVLAKVKEEEKG